MIKPIIALTLVVGMSVSGAAQVSSIEAARPPVKITDPSKKICEKIEVTGSRLGSRRICMTAADWATQRQDHRNDLERAQRNSSISPSG